MPPGPRGERGGEDLGSAAAAFYADLRLTPVLRQVLDRSDRLLGGTAGSISLVEPGGEEYVKAAERGASCQLGRRFPLDQGVTGQVVARRAPVLLERYGDLPAPHLPRDQAESRGPVAAVPIWWRGEVIGVNVLFAGTRAAYTAADVDELEVLTQVAAPAIVKAGTTDPSLAHLLRREAAAGVPTTVTEVGPARPVPPEVAGVAVELLRLAEEAASRRDGDARLHVAVVHRPEGLRLLLQDEDTRPVPDAGDPPPPGSRWQDLVAPAGGGVVVERVPGWGTVVRVDLPYRTVRPATAGSEPSPLSPREAEVLRLLARGLGDRDIADALVLSPRTVEKHVAAVRRKAGARSRTGAVVTALERGWLGPEGDARV